MAISTRLASFMVIRRKKYFGHFTSAAPINSFPVMVSNTMRPLPTPLSCVWPYLGQYWEKNQS